MRPLYVAIFFSIFFSVYGLLNYYVIHRIGQALNHIGFGRQYLFILIILAAAYPAARLMELAFTNFFTHSLVYVGSIYLAIFVWSLVAVLLVDLIRLVNHFFPFLHTISGGNTAALVRYTFFGLGSLILILTVIGFFNARKLRLRHLDLVIPRQEAEASSLKIAMASDIHLGTIVGNSRLERVVRKINALKPDIILFAGDVVDEDTTVVIENGMASILKKLEAPLGVFAATGNHEYIKDKEEAVRFLEEGDVIVLEDALTNIANRFWLAGRKDLMAKRNGEGRKDLAAILQGADRKLPVILMDHQPFRLEEAATNGVALQLSGHTHNGQLFPLNLITEAIYELSWGYLKKGNTHYYVSCGVGTWGPPIRIGSVPEIVEINIQFRDGS